MLNSDCWYRDVCNLRSNSCENHCIRFLEMKYLMQNCNLPESKQQPIVLTPSKCDLEAFTRLRDIKDNIVDFVRSGKNLYICSSITGNGKTSWAIKMMHKYFDEIWDGNDFRVRALFIHVPTFLIKCKDFKSTDIEFENLKKKIPQVDLVIWDEIAATDMSSYDYSQLLMYVDARSLDNKSNIYTGGITTRDVMEKLLGTRLTSRIWSLNTEVIEFFGGDRR